MKKIIEAKAAKYTGRVNFVVYRHDDHFRPNAKHLTFLDSHLLQTWQMTGSQNQRDCNDSNNDTTYKDLSSSQGLAVWASPEEGIQFGKR